MRKFQKLAWLVVGCGLSAAAQAEGPRIEDAFTPEELFGPVNMGKWPQVGDITPSGNCHLPPYRTVGEGLDFSHRLASRPAYGEFYLNNYGYGDDATFRFEVHRDKVDPYDPRPNPQIGYMRMTSGNYSFLGCKNAFQLGEVTSSNPVVDIHVSDFRYTAKEVENVSFTGRGLHLLEQRHTGCPDNIGWFLKTPSARPRDTKIGVTRVTHKNADSGVEVSYGVTFTREQPVWVGCAKSDSLADNSIEIAYDLERTLRYTDLPDAVGMVDLLLDLRISRTPSRSAGCTEEVTLTDTRSAGPPIHFELSSDTESARVIRTSTPGDAFDLGCGKDRREEDRSSKLIGISYDRQFFGFEPGPRVNVEGTSVGAYLGTGCARPARGVFAKNTSGRPLVARYLSRPERGSRQVERHVNLAVASHNGQGHFLGCWHEDAKHGPDPKTVTWHEWDREVTGDPFN